VKFEALAPGATQQTKDHYRDTHTSPATADNSGLAYFGLNDPEILYSDNEMVDSRGNNPHWLQPLWYNKCDWVGINDIKWGSIKGDIVEQRLAQIYK